MGRKFGDVIVGMPENEWPFSFESWLLTKASEEEALYLDDFRRSLLIELYEEEYDAWLDARVLAVIRDAGVNNV
jgi:hypothetical protein